MMASLFALFAVEMWLNSKVGGHSHGGPTGGSVEHEHGHGHGQGQGHGHGLGHGPIHDHSHGVPAGPSMKLPTPRNAFSYAQRASIYGTQASKADYGEAGGSDPMSTMPLWFIVFYEQYIRQHTQIVDLIHESRSAEEKNVSATESYLDEEERPVSPDVYRQMSIQITLLECGILLHSVLWE